MRELTRPINATPPYARAVRRASWKSRVDAKTRRTLQNSKLERYYHNTRRFRPASAHLTTGSPSHETRARRVAPHSRTRDRDCHTARTRARVLFVGKSSSEFARVSASLRPIETARKHHHLVRNESTGAKSLSAYPETLRLRHVRPGGEEPGEVQPTAAAARRGGANATPSRATAEALGTYSTTPPSAAPGRSRFSFNLCFTQRYARPATAAAAALTYAAAKEEHVGGTGRTQLACARAPPAAAASA